MNKTAVAICFFFICSCFAAGVMAQDSGKELLQQKTERQIKHIIERSPAVTGLAVVDLTSNETVFSLNADLIFPQASAIKIPILMEVFKQANQGEFSLSDQITIDPQSIVGGTGILKSMDGDFSMSIRNLSTLMIVLSDNSATNILIDLVGMASVNQMLKDLDAEQTQLRRKMMDIEASAKEHENTSTPAEAAEILQMLYDGAFIDEEISGSIVTMLKKTPRSESRIAAGLPDDVPVAFKPGGLAGVSTEWAIVLLEERPYAIAVMQNYMVEKKHDKTAEKISAMLYDYFWRLGNSTRYGVYRDPELMN